MPSDEVQTREDIATIRAMLDGIKSMFAASLDALKEQVKHANDNAANSVLLVRERQDRQFEILKSQLDAMDKSRETAKQEQQRRDEELKQGQQVIRSEMSERLDEHEQRLKAVEGWQTRFDSRMVGIALGVSVATGGTVFGLLKAWPG